MCTVLNTKNLLLHSLLIFAVLIEGFEGIAPDIYTEPSELAFEIFNVNDTSEKSFLLIQPVMEGSITARLGSYNSTHFYKMASINVFLNSHIVFVYKSHSSPLYALCSLENNYLVAHQNTFILCSFRVYVQSFDTHVLVILLALFALLMNQNAPPSLIWTSLKCNSIHMLVIH
ncbi:unnamed protein product [Heterobilharzia americana]|nr:unnamed protein product [Heterobilharzia americana]